MSEWRSRSGTEERETYHWLDLQWHEYLIYVINGWLLEEEMYIDLEYKIRKKNKKFNFLLIMFKFTQNPI